MIPPANDPDPLRPSPELPPEIVENMIQEYDAEILFSDYLVGHLIQMLKEKGLYNRTLVILLADHGEEFYEHRGWLHGRNLYGPSLWVPLIVHFPSSPFPPQRVETQVSLVDIYPTILRTLGLNIPDEFAGNDIRPGSSVLETRKEIYSELLDPEDPYRFFALIDRPHKAIQLTKAGNELSFELYDRLQDPAEKHNLTGPGSTLETSYREAVDSAKNRLQENALEAETVENLSADVIERLKGLGYLN